MLVIRIRNYFPHFPFFFTSPTFLTSPSLIKPPSYFSDEEEGEEGGLKYEDKSASLAVILSPG